MIELPDLVERFWWLAGRDYRYELRWKADGEQYRRLVYGLNAWDEAQRLANLHGVRVQIRKQVTLKRRPGAYRTERAYRPVRPTTNVRFGVRPPVKLKRSRPVAGQFSLFNPSSRWQRIKAYRLIRDRRGRPVRLDVVTV